MNTLLDYGMLGLLSGGVGGFLAALLVIFHGFRSLPEKPLSRSKSAIHNRSVFLTFRTVAGGLFGFIVTFWFIPEVKAELFPLEKLIFVQAITGFAGSFTPSMFRRNKSNG